MYTSTDKFIDLHTHSMASDGSLSPTELVEAAIKADLAAIALTDHDTVAGQGEFAEAGRRIGFETVPGVELSTDYAGEEVHVVGLFIDPACEALTAQLKVFRDNRDNRNLKMIEKLCETGFDITAEKLYERFPDSVVARPHMARYLVETGQAESVGGVFEKYIGADCPCYVERYKITPMEAVELIHGAGGLAVLAHPCLYKMDRTTLLAMVGEMKAVGLDGIEALYSRNRGSDEVDFKKIAGDFGLLVSGGSDFHGTSKPDISLGSGEGNLAVPYGLLEAMKKKFCA